jgi:hypothetical protein
MFQKTQDDEYVEKKSVYTKFYILFNELNKSNDNLQSNEKLNLVKRFIKKLIFHSPYHETVHSELQYVVLAEQSHHTWVDRYETGRAIYRWTNNNRIRTASSDVILSKILLRFGLPR